MNSPSSTTVVDIFTGYSEDSKFRPVVIIYRGMFRMEVETLGM